MEEKVFTIREAWTEAKKLGFKRSFGWWRYMVNEGLIKTSTQERNLRGLKDVHVIAFSEFVRVLQERPKLRYPKTTEAKGE